MFDIISRTYLIERLIGIGCYVIVVALMYNALLKYNAKVAKQKLNLCVLALIAMAFFFVPDEHKDLYRILEMTKQWSNLSLKEFCNSQMMKSPTAIGYFYYYLCRRIPFDGALPAITAALFYMNTFDIIKRLLNNDKLKKDSIAIAFIFFMAAGSFLEVISDIRNFLAFSIVVRCFILEWIDKRNILKSIPLYAIGALMHSAVIPLLIIRLIYYIVCENEMSALKKMLSVSALTAIVFVTYIKYPTVVTHSFDKAATFLGNDTYSYSWEYIIGVIQWLAISSITYKIGKNLKEYEGATGLIHINRMSKVLLILEAVLIFEYNIFHRFILVSLFFSIPQISFYLSNSKSEKAINNYKLICFLIFAIVCARGNLCGYKFFILN